MSNNVVSLSDYRDRHAPPLVVKTVAEANADRIARAQDSLQDASRALRDITVCLDAVAQRLGSRDDAAHERGQHRVVVALEKLHQCRADAAELTRLIEAGDIDGCLRLRESIQARVGEP
jgi:hypothetical protein